MNLLYTFYGDDFTGSTDVLEQLAAHGVRSVLFLAPPAPEQLQQFSDVQAFGIAGDSRSRSPEWMSEHLPRIFAGLRRYNAPIVHYKVCSTFDSSPMHGSIGRAIELGVETFHPRFVPIVVGAPHLGRFVSEGKLFAAAPDGGIHRIDRHPMSRHPVTPMQEPDLRRHLAKQTRLSIGHIPHNQLHDTQAAGRALKATLDAGNAAILFDTLDERCLRSTGDLLWAAACEQPLFSASSSGLTAALLSAWSSAGLTSPRPSASSIASIARSAPLLVLSGSCSVVTARQIRWALAHGFTGIPVEPRRLLAQDNAATYRETLLDDTLANLRAGADVVLYTALGNAVSEPAGDVLGAALGSLLRDLLTRAVVSRAVLCGGDTSSHAVQQLQLFALTWAASLQPGAPLCRAHSCDPSAAPLELVLKGGQVGSEDFFAVARGV